MTNEHEERVSRVRTALAHYNFVDFAERLCAFNRTSLREVILPSHLPRVVSARHELWSLMHGTFGETYSEIARIFEVNHTTVISGIRLRESRIGGREYRGPKKARAA